MAKHTPGPWTSDCFLVTAENQREVTHTGLLGMRRSSYPDQGGGQEDEANAKLIAAAPDLLAALELCDTALEHLAHGMTVSGLPELQDRVAAVIAKAEGR